MATLFTYDPTRVIVTVAFPFYTGPIQGLAPETFIRFGRLSQRFKMVKGCEAQVTRVKLENREGFVDMVLEDASPFNLFLTAISVGDDATQNGVGVIAAKDHGSIGDLAIAHEAYLVGPPPFARGLEPGQTAWRFDAGRVAIFHGGKVADADPNKRLKRNPFTTGF